MKIFKIFFLFIVINFNCFSQEMKRDSMALDLKTGFSIETYTVQNYVLSFGGVVANNYGNPNKPNASVGLYFDVILVNQPIVAPRLKLSYNYLSFFGLNVNFANYFRDGINDFRVTPEINFSLYGRLNLFAGLNISTSKIRFQEISDFKLGIGINMLR